MGVVKLSTSADRTRTVCHECGGSGAYLIPRMGIVTDGLTLDLAMANPLRQSTVGETRHCSECAGRGWLPGMVIPV